MRRFIPAYAGNAAGVAHALGGAQVHPRIRGERATAHSAAIFNAGSSPHTRGTPQVPGHRPARHRFIPAYAGNAGRRYGQAPCRPVHPRIRGERSGYVEARRSSSGSSPHTRGTLAHAARPVHQARFIPAYAGNARPDRMAMLTMTVHPRIRGERVCMGLRPIPRAGSSPHTRGTLFRRSRHILNRRFIPAYAGNAAATPRPRPARAVHPRIRGERPPGKTVYSFSIGSSPHTRGTPPGLQSSHPVWRFIPAYAGNALAPQDRASQDAVHPRIRGERYTIVHAVRIGDRFIPAYAGNAILASAADKPLKVHPRIRGERCRELDRKYYDSGSSPHTRGTRQRPVVPCGNSRFIPAYAGNARMADG